MKEIDNNDDLYLSIINEPLAAANYNFEEVKKGFEDFLRRITEQPLNFAKRRTINPARAREMEKCEIIISQYIRRKNKIRKILAKLYRPFKKFKILEDFKQDFFRRKK